MKKLLLIFMFAGIGLFSCRDMDKDYREFIVPNGIIYPQKADSIKIYPGLNRVKIEWPKTVDPKVVKAQIYWNNYTDTVDVDILADADITSVIIEDLPENTYTFYIKTFDADGNSSIPSEVTGSAYGANFIQSLGSRPLTIIASENMAALYWGEVASSVTRFSIRYVTSSGQTVEKDIPLDETMSIITDFKQGGAITTLTYYMPFTGALDEVAAIIETVFPDVLEEMRIPSDKFRNAALPGDTYRSYAGMADFQLENIWDGSIQRGHYYSADWAAIPQHFTIALGRTVIIDRFKMYPRDDGGYSEMYNGSAPRFVEIWGTDNPPADGSFDNWHKIGEWEQSKPSGYGQGANVGTVTDEDREWFLNGGDYRVEPSEEIPNPYIPIKYLRFRIVHTFNTYANSTAADNMVMGELELWGRIVE
jgi:hypothetical protein